MLLRLTGENTQRAGVFFDRSLFLLMSMTLLEWMFGFNAGIDELFNKDTNLSARFRRMHGAAERRQRFFCWRWDLFHHSKSPDERAFSQCIALVSLFFPAQALVGYALGKMSIPHRPGKPYMASPRTLGFRRRRAGVAVCGRRTESLMKSTHSTHAGQRRFPPAIGWRGFFAGNFGNDRLRSRVCPAAHTRRILCRHVLPW